MNGDLWQAAFLPREPQELSIQVDTLHTGEVNPKDELIVIYNNLESLGWNASYNVGTICFQAAYRGIPALLISPTYAPIIGMNWMLKNDFLQAWSALDRVRPSANDFTRDALITRIDPPAMHYFWVSDTSYRLLGSTLDERQACPDLRTKLFDFVDAYRHRT
jgi:hypothetical protein